MRGRTGRRLALTVLSALTFLIVTGLAGYPVYVAPRTDPVSSEAPADAVVALGGVPGSAVTARRLFEQGYARHLVVSNPYGRAKNVVTELCRRNSVSGAPEPAVSCFVPDPSTTRGEAREIARMAEERGWNRVVVVAPTFHLSRARMIVRRCYSGDLLMVDAEVETGAPEWMYQYGYQSAGYLRAFTQHGC